MGRKLMLKAQTKDFPHSNSKHEKIFPTVAGTKITSVLQTSSGSKMSVILISTAAQHYIPQNNN
jgi:hypothetical protein